MNIHEKLETLECRRDNLARRVLNVAPDSVANITQEQISNGITLETLAGLNVPVLRYDTQVTIHGLMPALREDAENVTRNQNGSIGIRYAAIDAPKKELLYRCSRVVKTGWHVHRNSSTFCVYREFLVTDEEKRLAQKLATLEALRSVPTNLFFGSAGAWSLAYGAGYVAQATIGAIPQEHVWTLAQFFFGIEDIATLEEMEVKMQQERDLKRKQLEEECEKNRKEREAKEKQDKEELKAYLATVNTPRLTVVPRGPCKFSFYSTERTFDGSFTLKIVTVAKRGARLCAKVTPSFSGGFKEVNPVTWKKWDVAAANGMLFVA